MPKHKSLMRWWLGFVCLVAIALGVGWMRFDGASALVAGGGSGGPVNPAPQPRHLADLPPIRQPAMLIHPTVRKLQLFDGNRLVAEYDIQPDVMPPQPAGAILNRKVTEGEHGPYVLVTDTGNAGGAKSVLAVLHAQPLPADVNLPGVTIDQLQLLQLIAAMPVGSPVTILP